MIASAHAVRQRLRRVPLSVIVVSILLAVIILLAVFAPFFAPADPNNQTLLARLKPPGFSYRGITYWLGTDDLGRDLISRTLYGARISLGVAVLSVVVSTLVGVSLGMLAGWFRGWTETIIMRLVDIMMSIPAILLAVLTVAVLGPGFLKLVLVLGLT
ncbi:MAG: ABC transporter permease, partial [Pseudomonadota bacterium]|nr:ABC transporter permease [Pseudomonadota bacterium]